MPYLILMTLFTGSLLAETVSIISYDGRSRAYINEISEEEYTKTLVATKLGVDQELISPLKEDSKKGPWKLDKISVGLGATGEIGIGPYKYGVAIKQRFIYGRAP